jgi:hypothetical protein
MKRIVIVSMIALVALTALSTGVVFAQGNQPPRGSLQDESEGPLHDYMVKALAEALGISADQLETRLDNGESAYQIALSQGIAAQDIPALLTAAHAKALDSAVAAGVISQQQADWMKSRGFGRMGGMGNGSCGGTGRSQMMRGGHWQPTNP